MNKIIPEKILRNEINCMIECYTKELLKTFTKKEIIGIYLLGSANKKWDSKIDYIPGFSDVDLNVYVKSPQKIEKYFNNMRNALNFSRNCERNFVKKIPNSKHIPRLQAQLHNMFLEKYPDSLAPASSVKTIYGTHYEKCIPKDIAKDIDYKKQFEETKKQILSNQKYLREIPLRVMSANSYRMIRYLNEIYYICCSTVTQMLYFERHNKIEAMCLNKTSVIKRLESLGYKKIAKEYDSMLKNAYDYNISKDMNSAHKAILSGYNAITLCVEIAQKKN